MNQVVQQPTKKRKNGLSNSYGLEITYAPNLNIQYITEVDYIESLGRDYHCKFTRKQFFINGKQPTRLIDKLAEKCMDAIYPIHFRTSSFGVLKEGLNFRAIKERWQTKQKALQRAYSGAFIDNYFNQINDSLATKQTLLTAIQRELFYSLFSFKMEAITVPNQQKEYVDYTLPLDAYRLPIAFSGNQKIIEKGKKVLITYQGTDKANNPLKMTQVLASQDLTLLKTEGVYKGAKEIHFKLSILKERQRKIV